MFRAISIAFLIIFFVSNASSQQRIILLDNYYRCEGCKLTRIPVTKDTMVRMISKDASLDTAQEKIRIYFTSEGDRFALFRKADKKMYVYIRNTTPQATPDKGFGTYLSLTRGGNQKGGEDIYQIDDLLNYITDSLFIFDSIRISTTDIIRKDENLLRSLQVSYVLHGKEITRSIPYNSEKEFYTLSYDIIFGNTLTRAITDTIPVSVHYDQKTISGHFKVFFATPEEKKEMKEWAGFYKKQFPEWTVDQLADELYPFLKAKYSNASRSNFVKWLDTVQ